MLNSCAYETRLFHIVLFAPEIPPNTGNISRLAVSCNCALHLIKPLGFSLDEKELKRAGLDYWQYLDLSLYENFAEFLSKNENSRIFPVTKFGTKKIWEHTYRAGDYFLFGNETGGLPDSIHSLDIFSGKKLFLPMPGISRSLNLSNCAAVVIYEGLRQLESRS